MDAHDNTLTNGLILGIGVLWLVVVHLPRLDGGELALEDLRGRRVVVVFSEPHCGPCNALVPHLEKFHRENTKQARAALTPDRSPIRWERAAGAGIVVVMIS